MSLKIIITNAVPALYHIFQRLLNYYYFFDVFFSNMQIANMQQLRLYFVKKEKKIIMKGVSPRALLYVMSVLHGGIFCSYMHITFCSYMLYNTQRCNLHSGDFYTVSS